MIITLKQEMDIILEMLNKIHTVSVRIYEDAYLESLVIDLINEIKFVKAIFGEGYKKEGQK